MLFLNILFWFSSNHLHLRAEWGVPWNNSITFHKIFNQWINRKSQEVSSTSEHQFNFNNMLGQYDPPPRSSIEILAWGGTRPPPLGGTRVRWGGGDWRVIGDKIRICLKLAKKCKKRGLKWLSCTLFGEKLAKYALIVNDHIDYYQKAHEACQKF